MRFDRPGEMLLAAYSHNHMLVGVGGITVDPEITEALRMRRFYIRSASRRTGIGRAIAKTLLKSALNKVDVITLNAAPASFRFWESLGFVPDQQTGRTHVFAYRASMLMAEDGNQSGA
jgi:GNAT superfamily N-acetyltransferase